LVHANNPENAAIMFIPEQMRKINIFLQEQDVVPITLELARLGVLDLSENEQQEWGEAEQNRWSDLAATYTSQSHRLENLLATLEIPRQEEHPPEHLQPEQDTEQISSTLEEVEQALHHWQEQTAEVEEHLDCLRLLVRSIQLLQPLDISIEAMRNLQFLYLVLGTLPRENFANLQNILFRLPFVIVPIDTYEERVLFYAATDQAHSAMLDRALRSVFMQPLEIPADLTGAPAEVIETLEQKQAEAEQRLEELAQEREHLANQWGDTLLKLWRQARSNAVVTRTISRLGHYEEVYLLMGWVPKKALDNVMKTVERVAEQRASIEVLEPSVVRRRNVPTLLHNPPFLRPFEKVVSTFGFPGYNELDPTLLVALSFVAMFGIMFGDVGHGLLLLLAALGMRWRGKFTVVANVLLASGASSMIFGLLYGSVFGRKDILPHFWLSPLDNILDILIASIIFGVVLLNVGFLLYLVSTLRSRNWGEFLFSRNGLAGVWLYWALAGGILALALGFTFPLLLWVVLALVPIGIIFLHEPLSQLVAGERPEPEGGWGEYSIQAFFELFESLISYISNSFSFIRLGAFAVAHAVLSQVVLLLAGMAGGIGGWILFLLGTLVIVGFEGLIVAIQVLRLEYYEFFSKFFQGRGRAFVPLRLPEKAERI
jgi:V/A-type H+-transporting ATPase subunit I